ncbi:fatty acid hydroxylase [Cristinia sonorae]|uniref:Fatty acid hydroxylase n=1 Tax=Cristinia sonorae TaxID=1940300 RepID=A0A8K0USA1_9AGAR|nr:fatty acid hydroxylase [Cristinia sonorae]
MSTPIPSPPALPILGHATYIDKVLPHKSFMDWADEYGEIYRLDILGRKTVFINSYELLNEVCNEKRFLKSLPGPIAQTRAGIFDGLFTAYSDEPNWGIAHRLLMPVFNTASIRAMFDDMLDIASQLVLKWERFGASSQLDPVEDYTNLTLDTLALTTMSYRLNSFYRGTPHPFVQAMVDFLIESGLRANRPAIVNAMMRGTTYKYEQDIKTMSDLADHIIAERKTNPIDKPDLLNAMLYGKDPKTGQRLSDESIRYNLITFMIAGHETTSATLAFATYYLIKYPAVMRKLREEIDQVLGDGTLQSSDLSKMPYCLAVLRETLRLRTPAVYRTVRALEDTTLCGGKYFVDSTTNIVSISWKVMRDPKIWGEDSEEFNPERMMDGKFEKLPPNAWQPFGYGSRGCIGRALALQEAQITLACIVQKFDLSFADPAYELNVKQSLTIKPAHMYIHAAPRADKINGRASRIPSVLIPKSTATQTRPETNDDGLSNAAGAHPLQVLYGSNTGSSESFAQRIAADVSRYGFTATLGTLDSVANRLPVNIPVVIVTASFEGEPADNAATFVEWIEKLDGKPFSNLRYAVFGCGNREWTQTYQKIPKLIDAKLETLGADRIVERGETDAGAAEFFENFDTWETKLFKSLSKEYGTEVAEESKAGLGLGIEINAIDAGTGRATALRQSDAALGTVIENRLLTPPGAPAKRHIEFELPENTGYRAGDYLAILPLNPNRNVQRALKRFNLSAEQEITMSSTGPTSLPVGKPVSVTQLFSGYVELSQPATTRDLQILSRTECSPGTSEKLQALSSDFQESVAAKRLSVLDILEDYPDIKLSLGNFIAMLPTMRIRQYSISSSPLWNANRVSLTVSILESPSVSGRSEPFLGVASNYLASLQPGDKAQVAIRHSSAAFHPPEDTSVPMILFCAGSGLAPMRGFLQERALQKKAGKNVAKSLLFFGCRRPEEDYLYADSDLKEWVENGIVDVKPAFSRKSEESSGCKYVQNRVWNDRADINNAFDAGARFFTCGSRKVANGVKDVLTAIIKEKRQCSDEEAAALFQRATQSRYATDIFD